MRLLLTLLKTFYPVMLLNFLHDILPNEITLLLDSSSLRKRIQTSQVKRNFSEKSDAEDEIHSCSSNLWAFHSREITTLKALMAEKSPLYVVWTSTSPGIWFPLLLPQPRLCRFFFIDFFLCSQHNTV